MGSVKLEELKEALRIDYNDENVFLQMCLNSAESYLKDSIDNYDEKIEVEAFQKKVKMPIILISQELFDNRSLTTEKSEKVKYIMTSLMTQLKFIDVSN